MDRTGGELIQDFLGIFEIPYVFGNPGTTETTFLAAVAASKATYVLALHESSAVGVAAGYALVTGKPSVVSLHTYPGRASRTACSTCATHSWPASHCSWSTDSRTPVS
jgi:benzoylformate decarboxylase